jgi:hypothetical protein
MSTEDVIKIGVNKICNKIRERLFDNMQSRGINVLAVRPIMWDRCISLFHSQSQKLSD